MNRIKNSLQRNTIWDGKVAIAILMAIYAIYIYFLNSWMPYVSDDFYYRFVRMYYFNQEVSSLGDIFNSQYLHFHNWGGRNIIHGLLQILLMLSPDKVLFNVCNTIVWLLFLWVIMRIAVPRQNNRFIYWLFAVVGVRFLLPESSYLYYWAAGSFNYYWVSVIAAVFFFLYRKAKHGWHIPTIAIPLIFIFSLLTGWLHESLMLGVWVALVVEMIFDRRCRTRLPVIMFVGVTCGLFVLMIAPGNYVRLEIVDETTGFISRILKALFVLSELRLSWLLLVVVLYEMWRNKSRMSTFICHKRFFVVVWLINLAFCMFLGIANRALFFVELIAFILLMSYMPFLFDKLKLKVQAVLSIVILVLLAGYEVVVGCEMCQLGNLADKSIQEYRTSTKDYLISPEWEPHGLVRDDVSSIMALWKIYNPYLEIKKSHRMFRILPQKTYRAIVSGELFDKTNRFERGLPFYTTDSISYVVMPCDGFFAEDEFVEFNADIKNIHHCLYRYANGRFIYHLYPASTQDPNLSLLGWLRRVLYPASLSSQKEVANNSYSINPLFPYEIEGKQYVILQKSQFRRIEYIEYQPFEGS